MWSQAQLLACTSVALSSSQPSIKYRLVADIFSSAGRCPACSAHSATLGDHALCCGSAGERVARHNALRDALYSTAVSALLGPSREGRFLLPGDDRRPADVLVPHWTGGQDTAWDVTVIHPLQAATVAGAVASPGPGGLQETGDKIHPLGGGVPGWLAPAGSG